MPWPDLTGKTDTTLERLRLLESRGCGCCLFWPDFSAPKGADGRIRGDPVKLAPEQSVRSRRTRALREGASARKSRFSVRRCAAHPVATTVEREPGGSAQEARDAPPRAGGVTPRCSPASRSRPAGFPRDGPRRASGARASVRRADGDAALPTRLGPAPVDARDGAHGPAWCCERSAPCRRAHRRHHGATRRRRDEAGSPLPSSTFQFARRKPTMSRLPLDFVQAELDALPTGRAEIRNRARLDHVPGADPGGRRFGSHRGDATRRSPLAPACVRALEKVVARDRAAELVAA